MGTMKKLIALWVLAAVIGCGQTAANAPTRRLPPALYVCCPIHGALSTYSTNIAQLQQILLAHNAKMHGGAPVARLVIFGKPCPKPKTP